MIIKKSKYKGVSWASATSQWRGRCKGMYVGAFDDEREAALAVDKFRIQFGMKPNILKPKSTVAD